MVFLGRWTIACPDSGHISSTGRENALPWRAGPSSWILYCPHLLFLPQAARLSQVGVPDDSPQSIPVLAWEGEDSPDFLHAFC